MTSQKSHSRCNKPLLERKRRERINGCLAELKTLIMDALQGDNSRFSKLEKADVLEMTVKHLKKAHARQVAVAMETDVRTKYRAGFLQCVDEVSRYLGTMEGIQPEMMYQLLHHLSYRMTSSQPPLPVVTSSEPPLQPIYIEIPNSPITPPSGNVAGISTLDFIDPALEVSRHSRQVQIQRHHTEFPLTNSSPPFNNVINYSTNMKYQQNRYDCRDIRKQNFSSSSLPKAEQFSDFERNNNSLCPPLKADPVWRPWFS